MNLSEKIGAFFITNEQTNMPIFKLTFDSFPWNYKVPLTLGLYGLKKDKTYKIHLEIFNEDGTPQVDDRSIIIKTNGLRISDDNSLENNHFGSLFGISSAILKVNKGNYEVKVSLFNENDDSTPLDTAHTFFYATTQF